MSNEKYTIRQFSLIDVDQHDQQITEVLLGNNLLCRIHSEDDHKQGRGLFHELFDRYLNRKTEEIKPIDRNQHRKYLINVDSKSFMAWSTLVQSLMRNFHKEWNRQEYPVGVEIKGEMLNFNTIEVPRPKYTT